jgi:hypothetical protein
MEAAARRTDQPQLFEEHAVRLHAVVSQEVHTSPANVEDACGFAWLQLVRRRPPPAVAFVWLCATAIREAMKLHRRTSQTVEVASVADVAEDARHRPDVRLELIAAGEAVRRARLRQRETQLVSPRVAGYSRRQMAALTGDTCRTIDRQLGRAHRKLRVARRADMELR